VPKGRIIEGRKWLVEDADIFSCIRYYHDKKLTVGQWIRSYRGVKEAAWFSGDDLFPFFIIMARFVKEMTHRLIGLVSRKIQRLVG
jgi:hypothetical protein